jgi:hypothetical protein
VAVDAEGSTWVADQGGCALRRVAPDGSVSTVLAPQRVCAPGALPADRVTLAHLAWDATRGELVTGGDILTHNQLTTTVWRIRADGTVRRVLLGHKLGASPAGAQLDGMWIEEMPRFLADDSATHGGIVPGSFQRDATIHDGSTDGLDRLLATLASWNASGLLALVDDAVAVLSAPLDEEISACLEAGFRVYTPRAAETAALRARHAPWLNAFGPASERPPFPPVRNLGGNASRPATYVGPAQAMAYLEMALSRALLRCGDAEGGVRLCEFLDEARVCLARAARAELAAATGRDFGFDSKAWRAWLAEQGAEIRPNPLTKAFA